MNTSHTVQPILLALILGLANQALEVYKVGAWGVGILKLEPWRNRSILGAGRALARSFAWVGQFFTSRAAVACAAALAMLLLVSDTQAASVSGLSLIGIAGLTDEPTLKEAKDAIETLNRSFEEFKRTNDERIRQIGEKGHADPALQAKLDKIEADVKAASDVADNFAKLEARVNRLSLSGGGDPDDPKSEAAEVRAFNRELRSDAQFRGVALPKEMSAEELRTYKKGFAAYLRRGKSAEGFDERAMSVGGDPDGGYLVTPDLSGRIVRRVYETSPIEQIASIQTISTDKLEGLRDIEEASGGGWVGETGGRTATTTPTFGEWKIEVHEQYENPGVTQKMIDDAQIDVEGWLAEKVADKMVRRRNAAFVTGNGVAKPRGFAAYDTAATSDASRAWGVLEHLATGTSAGFGADPNGADKLIELAHMLKVHFRQNAKWVMARLTLAAVRKLKDTNGSYIWLPTMQAGQPSQLLGYQTVEAEDMPAIAANSLSIAFGDFKAGYQIVNRVGIRVLRDPFTNKPYVQFYTTMRVGGDVIDFEAIKFLKFSA